jgi:hypothetical protein
MLYDDLREHRLDDEAILNEPFPRGLALANERLQMDGRVGGCAPSRARR